MNINWNKKWQLLQEQLTENKHKNQISILLLIQDWLKDLKKWCVKINRKDYLKTFEQYEDFFLTINLTEYDFNVDWLDFEQEIERRFFKTTPSNFEGLLYHSISFLKENVCYNSLQDCVVCGHGELLIYVENENIYYVCNNCTATFDKNKDKVLFYVNLHPCSKNVLTEQKLLRDNRIA